MRVGKNALGEFEEVVMLTVGILYDEEYGVAVMNEIEQRLNRKVSVGALQSALTRLESKGFLQSREGDPNPNRAGRPKRFFTITASGQQALEEARSMRQSLWEAIPTVAFPNKS